MSVSQGTEHKIESLQIDEMKTSSCHSSVSKHPELFEDATVWVDKKEDQ